MESMAGFIHEVVPQVVPKNIVLLNVIAGISNSVLL
jgi:hypothetical protein